MSTNSPSRVPHKIVSLLLAVFLFNCSTANHINVSSESRSPAASQDQSKYYVNHVQPIFNNRCVVCHSCNDAPCQLHLDSYAGIRRGATSADIGSSLVAQKPTRDKDGTNVPEWRKKEFFPVIPDIELVPSSEPEIMPSAKTDAEASLLVRFIELGHQNNQNNFDLIPIVKHREQTHVCPSNQMAAESFAKQFSFAGMPYGLPGLDARQVNIIKTWVAQGAPPPLASDLADLNDSTIPDQLNEWEESFNATSKGRLMARYIYEHVFSAHIHFKDSPPTEWYELVRSGTPLGQPVGELVTNRPYDAPKQKKATVYYRFKRFARTIARPSHIPWEIDSDKLEHLKKSFLQKPWLKDTLPDDAEFEVVQDPGYESTNPFVNFKQIPAEIRYQFLLDNSQLIANAMIRGPACSGHIATYAIRDHFWVFFIKPESDVTVRYPEIGENEWAPIEEIAMKTAQNLRKGINDSDMDYITAMNKDMKKGFAITDLWTGENTNPNALLTILRHGTNASVHQGLLAGRPHTMWLLNFSNFERIYYNLVADFEIWGSSAHKAATWEFMSEHRSEAEERLINLLPKSKRNAVRENWTQKESTAGKKTLEKLKTMTMGLTQNLLVDFRNQSQADYSKGIDTQIVLPDLSRPVDSLVALMLKQYAPEQITIPGQLSSLAPFITPGTPQFASSDEWAQYFTGLLNNSNLPIARYMPDVVYIRVKNQTYTILNHRFYKFNDYFYIFAKQAYDASKNKLSLVRGLIGDRPEFFADLKEEQLTSFITAFKQNDMLISDWEAFKTKYFIRRNNPRVWELSDWFIRWLAVHNPNDAGIIDMREYDVQSE
jgi:hypothetical protein